MKGKYLNLKIMEQFFTFNYNLIYIRCDKKINIHK